MSDLLIGFIVTCIVVEVTPGPNMGYLAVLSLDRGRLAGLAAVAGVAIGLAALGLAAGLGLGVLIGSTPWLYETIRWVGVAYLLWLAFDTWQESRRPLDELAGNERFLVNFRRGLVTNLLNPKAALFYVAVVPSFIDPLQPVAGQTLLLTAIYVAIATLIHVGIVLAAASIKPLVVSSTTRERLGLVFAVLLAAIAIWLAFSTQRAWG